MTIVIAILLFGGLIFVHELGHYLTARACGIGVREFSIGMGPKLFGWVGKKNGTQYSLRLLPIGGYVSMYGEDEDSDREDAFHRKPVWQRMLVTVAGAAMNILIGFLLTLAMILSSNALGSTIVAEFTSENAVSAQGGLAVNDEIVKIGRVRTHTYIDVAYEIMRSGGEPIDITVVRNGETVTLRDIAFQTTTEEGIVYGNMDFRLYGLQKTFGGVLKHTWYQSVSSIRMIWQSLFDLITGKYGFEQVSGPVGTTQTIGEAATAGSTSLLYICALIAMNLGVFNLLPFPALDGGRIVFLLIEFIRRKPIKREIEGYINLAGLALLLLLMLAVTAKDLWKLFV